MYSRVYVEITNICNRACTFCPGTKREKRRITKDEFVHVLGKLEGLTQYIYLHVMGEPLTHPELCDLIRLATERGFKCAITTNGTLLPKRGDELLSFKMTREAISEKSVGYAIDPETNIAYIRIASFKSNTADQFIEAVDAAEEAGVRGIIFDVRFNPGGYVNIVKKMLSYLVPTGEILASYRYSGQVVVVDKAYDDVHPTKKDENGADLVEDHVISVPVVVICDEYTASSGELFTAAIRDYRDMGLIDATIVGATTYKKGIMQNTYTYSLDRSSITFTVAYYDPPCGENYHGIGVIPDVEVPSSYTEDLQYPRALEELEKLINSTEQ